MHERRRKSSAVFSFSDEELRKYHAKIQSGQIKVLDVIKYHTGVSRSDMVKSLQLQKEESSSVVEMHEDWSFAQRNVRDLHVNTDLKTELGFKRKLQKRNKFGKSYESLDDLDSGRVGETKGVKHTLLKFGFSICALLAILIVIEACLPRIHPFKEQVLAILGVLLLCLILLILCSKKSSPSETKLKSSSLSPLSDEPKQDNADQSILEGA
jgi:hypothetical protein